MKGEHCSWVDIRKIRQELASGNHGDQARLERMRCVEQTTVSKWKAACDLLAATETKQAISPDSGFWPSHAIELVRFLRRNHGKDFRMWPEDLILNWIARVEEERLTVLQLRELLRKKRVVDTSQESPFVLQSLEEAIERGLLFGTVYADPPWQYDNQATRASTSNHYGTMTVAEIAALPVPRLALPQSCLFLWTTGAFLPHSFGIIEAWGFEYKTYAVWCKPQLGIGNYFRKSTELLLVGTRGGCRFDAPVEKDWFQHDRIGHSRKPELFRKIIESVAPPPRLEMFGRRLANGWYVWGDEVEIDLFHKQDTEEDAYERPQSGTAG